VCGAVGLAVVHALTRDNRGRRGRPKATFRAALASQRLWHACPVSGRPEGSATRPAQTSRVVAVVQFERLDRGARTDPAGVEACTAAEHATLLSRAV